MSKFYCVPLCVLVTTCVALPVLSAAEKSSSKSRKGVIRNLAYDPDADTVKLFEGLDEGHLEARVVPKNEFEARVYVSNKTEKPLTVILPKAVVAVHVLKQYNTQQTGNGLGNLFGNQQQQQGGAQSIGGIFQGNQAFTNQSNGVNNGNNNLFNGTNFFSIPPEKTIVTKINTVCLDHGKKTPSPGKKYVLRKIEDHTSNPVLQALLENYDPRKIDRKTMQAATWHLSSNLDWKQLRTKKLRLLAGISREFFSRKQLQLAQKLVTRTRNLVATNNKEQVRSRKAPLVSRL